MILVIDNYDSFVYNLARYVRELDQSVETVRNDALTLQDIRTIAPEGIILSPGPCSPQDAGICIELVRTFGADIPILGVCLGHQAINEAYGGTTQRSPRPVHGKASNIHHNGEGLFASLPKTINVGRYHSLCVSLPENSLLHITAETTESGEIMAIQHHTHPVYGVQFHPESVLTPHGKTMMQNFLTLCEGHKIQKQSLTRRAQLA